MTTPAPAGLDRHRVRIVQGRAAQLAGLVLVVVAFAVIGREAGLGVVLLAVGAVAIVVGRAVTFAAAHRRRQGR